jgi:hypothetical protein
MEAFDPCPQNNTVTIRPTSNAVGKYIFTCAYKMTKRNGHCRGLV